MIESDDQKRADAGEAIIAQRQGLVSRVRDLLERPSVLSIIDQAVVSATNLVTGVALGRYCAAEGYGSYVLAMTVAIVGTGLLTELVTNPFTIYGQRRRGRALATYSGSAVIHLAIFSVLLVAAILGVIAACGQIDKLTHILPVVLVAAPLVMTREFARQMSFARFQFRNALTLDMAVSATHLSGLAILWSTGRLSAGTALVALAVACGVSAGVWLLIVRRQFRFSLRHARVHARRNWRFARWTMVAYAIGSTTPFVMPWVLAGFHNEVETGRLAAANTLIGLSFMFVTGISNWLTAKAAHQMQKFGTSALKQTLTQTTVILASVLVPFVVTVWFCGEWLVVFVYGDAFSGLGIVSFIIALGVLANAGNVLAGNGLWALNRPQPGIWADATTLTSTIVLALVLVPTHDVIGAAWATTCGVAAGAVVRTMLLRHAMQQSERSNTGDQSVTALAGAVA